MRGGTEARRLRAGSYHAVSQMRALRTGGRMLHSPPSAGGPHTLTSSEAEEARGPDAHVQHPLSQCGSQPGWACFCFSTYAEEVVYFGAVF